MAVDSAGQTAVVTHNITEDCKCRQRPLASLVYHYALYNSELCNVTIQNTVMKLLFLYTVGILQTSIRMPISVHYTNLKCLTCRWSRCIVLV
jgi:hypothetical protein